MNDENECQSCVDGKCVTGEQCVTLGRDTVWSANELLRKIATLKRHDPNKSRGRQRAVSTCLTVNVPIALLERIDALLGGK